MAVDLIRLTASGIEDSLIQGKIDAANL